MAPLRSPSFALVQSFKDVIIRTPDQYGTYILGKED